MTPPLAVHASVYVVGAKRVLHMTYPVETVEIALAVKNIPVAAVLSTPSCLYEKVIDAPDDTTSKGLMVSTCVKKTIAPAVTGTVEPCVNV